MAQFRFIKIHFNCEWEKRYCVYPGRAAISAGELAIIFPAVLSADDIVNFPDVIGFWPRCERRGLRAMKADYFHGDPAVLINNALSCGVNATDSAGVGRRRQSRVFPLIFPIIFLSPAFLSRTFRDANLIIHCLSNI